MSKIKVAITGTIGSGKSTVSLYLRNKGYEVFDCDECNRELLNNKGYELLHKDFADCFLENNLDKAKLANVVFNNPERKKILENIMHPLILDAMNKLDNDILIAEVPLLFESNWDLYFDYKVLVVTDKQLAINRLLDRGLNIDSINARMASQMPVEEKIKKANRIIYNNGSLLDLESEVDKLILEVLC